MELRRYWLIIRRWMLLGIAAFIASAVLSGVIAERQSPTYESRVRIIVGPTLSSQESGFDVLRSASQLVLTYRELVKTPPILDATITTLKLDDTRAELAGRISVSSSDLTRLLSIRVRDSSPDRAALIANTIADVLIQQNSQQQQSPESQLTVVDSAEPNLTPVSPNKPLIVMLGVAGAMLLVAGVVLAVELLQGYVKTDTDVRRITGASSLGLFRPIVHAPARDPYFARDASAHPAPEQYQIAGLKLLSGIKGHGPGTTILVCSPADNVAVSEVSAYLAAAIAQTGQSTLAVDADLGSRGLSRLLGLEEHAGFVNLVAGWENGRLESGAAPSTAGVNGHARVVRQYNVLLHATDSIPDLFVLPAGARGARRAPTPEQLSATIEALASVPAITIIAGPPLIASADALTLAKAVDGVLLVTTADETRAVDLQTAAENLELVGARQVWGLIMRHSPVDRWRHRRFLRRAGQAQLVGSGMTLEAARRMPLAAASAG